MSHRVSPEGPLVATYSVVARDPATGDLGVAVASKFLAVGAYVPAAQAGVGAVATQAHVNTTYGTRALELMAGGASPDDCVEAFRAEDPNFDVRQFGIVAANGASASWTGPNCHAWAGGVTGPNFAAQGNIVAGPEVVNELVRVMADESTPFPERLVQALAAAEAAGGDKRGRQSAALLVVGHQKGYAGLTDRWIDLRVDDHEAPVAELARMLGLHRLFLDKPSQPPHQLSGADITLVQQILERHGYLDRAPTGAWDDATQSALEALFGVENLEERWHVGPQIDPVAWDHIQKKLGGK